MNSVTDDAEPAQHNNHTIPVDAAPVAAAPVMRILD